MSAQHMIGISFSPSILLSLLIDISFKILRRDFKDFVDTKKELRNIIFRKSKI